ncbi:MAG: IS110 family transposase [Bacteroidetes bacterium]|nr:IS110 family transposase [Bacteroidota bacterium]
MIQNNMTCDNDSELHRSCDNEANRFCGLDIHKSSIIACIKNISLKEQVRTFGTTTTDLEKLRDWLYENEITHLAMESTGSYWKPVFNILDEGDKIKLMLVNAKQLKFVPGRKSDVKDCQWLSHLLQLGLLKGSFVPPEDIRNLRDLTRYEVKLQHQLTGHKNRIHRILHECNIKLCDVLTDIFGKTGFKILKDLSEGKTDAEELSKYFLQFAALKKKYDKARIALNGKVSDHHQFMLRSALNQIESALKEIDDVNSRIKEKVKMKFSKEQDLLKTIPGVDEKTSQTIIAELGVDMEVFPSENHAASWAGTCPSKNKSGENIRHVKNSGNRHLKSALNQSSWSTIKCKDSFLKGKYYYLAGKIGAKRALSAIANKLLKSAYHVLSSGKSYIDRHGRSEINSGNMCYLNGVNSFKDKINLVKNYVRDLNKDGYKTVFEISDN